MNANLQTPVPIDAMARVGIYARSETRMFLVKLARLLKERYGSTIFLYCDSEKSEFYSRHGGDIFADIIHVKSLHACSVEPTLSEHEELSRAETNEALIGQTYNFLSVANRHLGRGYALGGFHHLRSRYSEETNYVNFLHAYNEVLDFWKREVVQRGLTLLINGPREAAIICRAHGVPFRNFAGSRYKNYHNWAWNEYYENPEFELAYKRGDGCDFGEFERPYDSHLVNRNLFIRQQGLFQLSKRLAYEIIRFAWWRLRGYEKAQGYYFSERLALIWRTWTESRLLNRLATTTLEDLNGRRFVFFPLQLEPEAALQGLSPEYFYQLSTIAAIARDLPAGVLLAVKEAFGAIGRRPRDFYGQIAEFKNVVMLQAMELGLDCVRQADVTVTICGTAGFEGAVLGKPVIVFGRHNNYKILPHVRFIERQSELRGALVDALNAGPDAKAAADGRRLLQAIVSCSFDMRDYDFIHVDNVDPRSVEDACRAIVRGLTFNLPTQLEAAS